MQVRYQFEATPARTLVAVFLALAALLVTGALGYSLGKANGAGHATAAPGHSVVLPASQAAGQTLDDYSFRYGPADRTGALAASQVPGQVHGNSSFPYGPADRAGG